MSSRPSVDLRKHIHSIFFLLVSLYCVPSSAFSPEDFCITKHKNFIARYFSAQSDLQELENFFDCLDNTIQLFLNHTNRGNPNYYTRVEIRRFMQYMGATRSKAEAISRATLNLKTGFIGGRNDRLTMNEIRLSRTILSILRQRMRAIHSAIPTLVKVLNKENVPRQSLLTATDLIYTNLTVLGSQLSKYSFSSQLHSLENLPQNLQAFDFSSENLKYWRPAVLLLSKWNKFFLKSPNNSIHSNKWPALLDSFASLTNLWFYYKRFLEGRSWIDSYVIQHTQYFLSLSLEWIQKTQKKNRTGISLHHIDELARQAGFYLLHLSPFSTRSAFRILFFNSPISKPSSLRI